MRRIDITYLNGPDVERLALGGDEILSAVEECLRTQGNGQTVIEPRVHLVPASSDRGHFNVLRGVVKPLGVAGVKVVGDFVVPYGTMSAVELSLTDIMDKIVVDNWSQCRKGLPFGALRQHVDSDRLHEGNLHAELGQIVAGLKRGRAADDETILFWHRGLSITDIALGHALLAKAAKMSIGQMLRFAWQPGGRTDLHGS